MPTDVNLWPDTKDLFAVPDETPPVVLLRQQADALADATRGLVEARVTTRRESDGRFLHKLRVLAPLLNGYSRLLLSVAHGLDFYPAVLRTVIENGEEEHKSGSSEELKAAMKVFFTGQHVRKLLKSLVAQSRSSRNLRRSESAEQHI